MQNNINPKALSAGIGDAEISYLDYEGSGETIIFLHATGFMPWIWHPIARKFAGKFRVIAPYFCDHRSADPYKGGLDWLQLADDFTKFCNVLNIKKPYLVGHSMGATVITIASVVSGLESSGMVLIEPIFLPDVIYKMDLSVEQHPLASKSIKRRDGWVDSDEAFAYLKSRPLFMRWDDEMLHLYLKHGMKPDEEGLKLTCSPVKEASLFMGGTHFNPWPILPEVTCPVLVIEGALSENRGFIEYEKATSLFPKGRYLLVEDAGHLIPMEKPVMITKTIQSFFSEK
jgi:lipase